MAHDLTDNKMVYVKKTETDVPWHGLGTPIPANAEYGAIVEAAGFYTALERELYTPDGLRIPDRKAIIRGDDGRYLSVVSKNYTVIQFADVANTIVRASGDVKAVFNTAGCLGETGAVGWLLGELPDPVVVRGDPSPIRKYFVGVTGHDGKTAIKLKSVGQRVVCRNTLSAAMSESGSEWTIYHSKNAENRMREAAEAFRKLHLDYLRLGELANILAATPFTDAQHRATVDAVLPVPEDGSSHTKLEEARSKVRQLFEVAIGLTPEIRGTAWASVQAWTEFSDHHRTTRGNGRKAQEVMVEGLFLGGKGENMKRDAVDAILTGTGIKRAKAADLIPA